MLKITQSGGILTMNEFVVRFNDKTKNIKIIDESNAKIDGLLVRYEFVNTDGKNFLLKLGDKFYESSLLSSSNGELSFVLNGKSVIVNIKSSLEEKAFQLLSHSQNNENSTTIIKSPMPGLVLKIKKQKGDSIIKGETVLILEAMKMENEIKSPKDGILEEIFVKEGTAIEKNISLVSIK